MRIEKQTLNCCHELGKDNTVYMYILSYVGFPSGCAMVSLFFASVGDNVAISALLVNHFLLSSRMRYLHANRYVTQKHYDNI